MLPYCETLLQIQPYCRIERDSRLLCKAHPTSAEPDRHTHPFHPGCTTQHQGPRIMYVQCTFMGRHFVVSQDTASSQLTTPKRYTEVHSSSVPVYHPSTSFVLKLSHQHLHGLPSTHFRNGIATTVHVF